MKIEWPTRKEWLLIALAFLVTGICGVLFAALVAWAVNQMLSQGYQPYICSGKYTCFR
jgi:preprotein translocase subunit SecE